MLAIGLRVLTLAAVTLCDVAPADVPVGGAAGQAAVQTTPPSTASAAEIYDRIGAQFAQLDSDFFDGLEGGAVDPQAEYLATGVADERMQRWLHAARPLAAELIRARTLRYSRPLDRSQGFALLLPHLALMRNNARAMTMLLHDAALRGDTTAALELACAQATLASRCADDGILISSLVSIASASAHMNGVSDLIETGSINAEAAQALLEARKALIGTDSFGVNNALRCENGMLVSEFDRLAATPAADRAAYLAQIGVTSSSEVDDEAIATTREQAAVYYAAVRDAMKLTDRSEGKSALAALHERLESGEFGDLLKTFAPSMDRILSALETAETKLAAQDALLKELATGAKSPLELANAMRFYLRAARGAAVTSIEAQHDLELVRVGGSAASEDMRRNARRECDAARADVLDLIVRGSRCGNCSLWSDAKLKGGGLLPVGVLGVNGAVRMMLADALLTEPRSPNSLSAVDACVAALRAMNHFASLETFAHSLVAQQIARDVALALADFDARGALDQAARERFAVELARVRRDDPFGFRRALKVEGESLAQLRISSETGVIPTAMFDRERLANLSPNALAFLTAMLTEPRAELSPEGCRCAHDGVMLDVRSWFDLAALARAREQYEGFHARGVEFSQENPAETVLRDGPLTHLAPTVPLDISVRMLESSKDLDALDAFAKVTSATAPARALSE